MKWKLKTMNKLHNLIVITVFLFIGCEKRAVSGQENKVGKNEATKLIENEFCSYEVLKNDLVTDELDVDDIFTPFGSKRIEICSSEFEYERLYRFEPEAFSPLFYDFLKRNENPTYENVCDYFNSNLDTDEYVFLSDFSGYGSDGTYFIPGSRKRLIIESEILGEYAVGHIDTDSYSVFNYEFILIGQKGLVNVTLSLTIKNAYLSIPAPQKFIYDVNNNLVWKDSHDVKLFVEKMESEDYETLEKTVVLFRKSKDLLLKTIKLKK